MRSGIRVGVCTLVFVAALATRSLFAAEPPKADPEVAGSGAHAATAEAGAVDQAGKAGEEKAKLSVTPVAEWDPDMEIIPFNSKEGLRVALAHIRTQIEEVRKDPSIKEEDKAKQIELLEKVMKGIIATFRSVNEYNAITTGIFICPYGAEVPLNFLLPKRLQGAKVSVAAAPCILLTMTKNYGANRTNGLVFGIGGWAGGQIARNNQPGAGQIEIQSSGGFFLPLNGKAPVLKLGDIQGYYAGGGLEVAVDSTKTTENNGGSGGLGGYVKVEGLNKPDVAIVMAVYGRNDQQVPFQLKGEGFYFGVPYATDGSRTRPPNYPFTATPITEAGKTSQHRPEERIKKYSSQEILDLIKGSKEELNKTR